MASKQQHNDHNTGPTNQEVIRRNKLNQKKQQVCDLAILTSSLCNFITFNKAVLSKEKGTGSPYNVIVRSNLQKENEHGFGSDFLCSCVMSRGCVLLC